METNGHRKRVLWLLVACVVENSWICLSLIPCNSAFFSLHNALMLKTIGVTLFVAQCPCTVAHSSWAHAALGRGGIGRLILCQPFIQQTHSFITSLLMGEGLSVHCCWLRLWWCPTMCGSCIRTRPFPTMRAPFSCSGGWNDLFIMIATHSHLFTFMYILCRPHEG